MAAHVVKNHADITAC